MTSTSNDFQKLLPQRQALRFDERRIFQSQTPQSLFSQFRTCIEAAIEVHWKLSRIPKLSSGYLIKEKDRADYQGWLALVHTPGWNWISGEPFRDAGRRKCTVMQLLQSVRRQFQFPTFRSRSGHL